MHRGPDQKRQGMNSHFSLQWKNVWEIRLEHLNKIIFWVLIQKCEYSLGYVRKEAATASVVVKIFFIKKVTTGASLVAQWLRICLPVQGTRVRALVWEDPTCCGATRPVSHNYWACASGACAPQQERPWWWEARALRWKVAPACSK